VAGAAGDSAAIGIAGANLARWLRARSHSKMNLFLNLGILRRTLLTPIAKLHLIVCFLLIQSHVTSEAQTLNQELARILKALSQAESEQQTGYKVTALETNFIFYSSTTASKQVIQTNFCSYIYRFGKDAVFITCERRDLAGDLTQERKTLIQNDEIWEYTDFHKGVSNGEMNSNVGSIERRKERVLVGVPAFLSKSTLYDFITKSPSANVEIGTSSKGTNSYVIKISCPPKSLVDSYRLYLNSNTLMPVELNSYLPDGSVSSLTTLQFEDSGEKSNVCKRAESKIFSGGALIMQSFWLSVSLEKDDLPIKEAKDLDSFFPPLTRVSDRRFARPFLYHMGRRLPNSNEIDLILSSSNGVAKYEAATTSGRGMPLDGAVVAKKPSWPILAVLAFLAFVPMAYWAFLRIRTK
jgi:hypothetical protein